ncbi:MAG: LPS assembly lipoprotein LptE [Hyphomonadaceae bacterium]
MKWVLVLAVALLSAGCGFSPMYGQLEAGQTPIGPVAVNQIDGRAGHVLRAELTRVLAVERGAGPPLTLDITLGETISGAGYRLDESASRANLTLIANYVLHFPNGAVARGSVSSVAQYSIPASAFGEVALQDDARERAAEVLAQRMRAELAIRVARTRREQG